MLHKRWVYLLFFACWVGVFATVTIDANPGFDCKLALKTIFKNEGGLSMDPDDSGNWTGGKVGVGKLVGTKYGIAGSVYGNYFLKRGKKIRDITIEEAAVIYQRDYAAPLHLELVKSQWLGTMILDTAVNCGTGVGAILVARTINVLNGKDEDFPVDPVLGKVEIDWMNSYTQTRIWDMVTGEKDRSRRWLFGSVFKEMRSRRYVAIVRHDSKKLKYLPTWLERTYGT